MPGLDSGCQGDADEALRIASGRASRAHGTRAAVIPSADDGRSNPDPLATPWAPADAGAGLASPGVHQRLLPGACGPCSLPEQRAPDFISSRTEANR